YKGQIAPNSTLIRSSTNIVYIKGFTQCYGPQDYKALSTIQEGYTLKPLTGSISQVGLSSRIASKESPQSQVASMEFTTFYSRLNALLQTNHPTIQDVAIQKLMQELGMNPEKRFDPENIQDSIALSLEGAFKKANEKIDEMVHILYSNCKDWI